MRTFSLKQIFVLFFLLAAPAVLVGFTEKVQYREGVSVGVKQSTMGFGRACATVTHVRAGKVLSKQAGLCNQITNSGRDFLHQQGYQTSGLGTNGLNYIALTNTAVTPGPTDTTLSGEIVSNGLSRTQGAVAHTTGTNTTTVTVTFTATGTQAAQATALFTAASSGIMNHELTFTQRTLQSGDQLVVTFTITLG